MLRKNPKKNEMKVAEGHGAETIIGTGVTFDGQIKSAGDIYIAGEVKGTIESKSTVVVNQGATVEADVYARTLLVHGNLNGSVTATESLEVGETGRLFGCVQAGAVKVAEGGLLDGSCKVDSSAEGRAKPTALTPPPKEAIEG
ncbi:MAG: hypothetical protein C0608_05470 [Deltaproteobacteria bacterium]|nr:MAG: hypothetical protein C0608_05470 [Deltaproteobacteria bacterium]